MMIEGGVGVNLLHPPMHSCRFLFISLYNKETIMVKAAAAKGKKEAKPKAAKATAG